jgi:hypothetical protein
VFDPSTQLLQSEGTDYAWNIVYQGNMYDGIPGVYITPQGEFNPRQQSMLAPDLAALQQGISAYNPGSVTTPAWIERIEGGFQAVGGAFESLIGATQATEAVEGENFLTGQALTGLDRWGTAFQSISAASGVAALGVDAAGRLDYSGWFRTAAENETPALNILNPEFTPDAGRVLQNATAYWNDQLAANPSLAGEVLTEPEYEAGRNSIPIARMQYGNAVERLVARAMRNELGSQLVQYTGGPGGGSMPDFVGVGPAEGQMFDITTPGQVASKAGKWYGPGLITPTYVRPITFRLFP